MSGLPNSSDPAVLGPEPCKKECTNCNKEVTTKTEKKLGMMNYIVAGVMCLLCCWLCAWIPLVVDSLKDVDHKCPDCGNKLGNICNLLNCAS